MFTSDVSTKIRSTLRAPSRLLVGSLLVLVLLLGAFLRFYHLGDAGYGNEYYAAAVKSMLQSWHNFFFVAFEPGGSVSLDKPPLGFWVQVLSAYYLGVNGFALALPNAIAGTLSILVVYKLVRRLFGPWAGLAAALVLAVMPVAISTERNNTIDGLLVFVLLLAAWAFLQSVYTGKIRWLFLGAFIVGLGFNIKMLQAFMPLPAFYALYFFAAKHKWWKKLLHLTAVTVILLVVSFSWAIAVDMVPASDRPYVDSTNNNTVMELIFGHNGIERLTRFRQRIGLDGGQDGLFAPDDSGRNQPPAGFRSLEDFGSLPQPPRGQNFPQGGGPQPPLGQNLPQNSRADGGQPGPGDGGGQPGSMDFGSAGTLRLFTEPLVGEASWLLPFVLGGLIILAFVLWKRPFGDQHTSVILWAGWLLPEVIYFSYSQGLMHSYYLIMMGAPIAALAAVTGWAFWQLIRERALLGWGLLCLLVAGTLIFQVSVLWGTTNLAPWAIGAAIVLFGLGLCTLAASMLKVRLAPVAVSLMLAALLVAPATWSALTTFNSDSNGGLPAAGPAQQGQPGNFANLRVGGGDARSNAPAVGVENGPSQNLLDYLLANTEPGTYLLATDRANDAAPYILATGRPVLTFGGFLGQYNEVSVDQLATLVQAGQLRFVLGQGLQQYSEIAQWIEQSCTPVDVAGLSPTGSLPGGPANSGQNSTLYDCGG